MRTVPVERESLSTMSITARMGALNFRRSPGGFPSGRRSLGGQDFPDPLQESFVRDDAVRGLQRQDGGAREIGRHPAEKRGFGFAEEEVKRRVGQEAQGRGSVLRRRALEPPSLEENREGFGDGGIILDNQKGTAHVE